MPVVQRQRPEHAECHHESSTSRNSSIVAHRRATDQLREEPTRGMEMGSRLPPAPAVRQEAFQSTTLNHALIVDRHDHRNRITRRVKRVRKTVPVSLVILTTPLVSALQLDALQPGEDHEAQARHDNKHRSIAAIPCGRNRAGPDTAPSRPRGAAREATWQRPWRPQPTEAPMSWGLPTALRSINSVPERENLRCEVRSQWIVDLAARLNRTTIRGLGRPDVAISSDGSAYVTGVTADNGNDAVLLKFDASGTLLWERSWGGTASDESLAVATASDDRPTSLARRQVSGRARPACSSSSSTQPATCLANNV